MKPDLSQLDLVVRDMEKALAFYRALGVEIPESAIWRTPSGAHHVEITMPGGLSVAWNSEALTQWYDRGWRATPAASARCVLTFHVTERADVDRIHDELAGLGHKSSQPPFDAFWGARYAIVEDPDGNHVGIKSAADPARRAPPPEL